MAQVAALFLLVFGFLPVADWIPGTGGVPWYGTRLSEWITGGSIALGAGIVTAIAMRSHPKWWREGTWARVAARWRRGDRRADLLVAVVVLVVCAITSQVILSGRPLLIDEILSLYQARILAAGHLWLPAPHFTGFTSALLLVDTHGKIYAQFPVGGPAMLALGVLVHAAWLVGPVATAVGAYLFARLLRQIESRDGTALAALLLYGFAPFTVFLGGSMMNHVTETTWLLAAALALALVMRPPPQSAAPPLPPPVQSRARGGMALLLGLCLGVAATIRPADAAAFALPAGAWMLWRARDRRHLGSLILSGVGVAVPLLLLFAANAAQTGDAFRFGYVELWGRSHDLGFHAAPWGANHTPALGLAYINRYFLWLQDFLFETAGPSLAFATAALALSRRLRAFDRWILVGSGLLILVYFAYWHEGFYLGPRFMLPLAPWLALWTARLPAVMKERRIAVPVIRGAVVTGVVALAIGAVVSVPLRAREYRHAKLGVRYDVDSLANAHQVHDAIVFVREWWGGAMVARLWSMGASRPEAQRLYRWSDACRLQLAIDAADRAGTGIAGVRAALAPYRSDSAQLRDNRLHGDTTIRLVPGGPLAPICLRRMIEDSAGFAVFPQMLLAKGGGNRYFRDMHARDSVLVPLLANHPVWLLTQAPEVGGAPRLEPVRIDSMRAEWQHQ